MGKTERRYCPECRRRALLLRDDYLKEVFPVDITVGEFETIYCKECEKYFFRDPLPPRPKLTVIKNRKRI